MSVATWIDQVFLKNDSATLAQLKRQLKAQIAALDREQQVKGGSLAQLEHLIDQAANQRREALAELAALAAQRQGTAAEVAALTQRREQLAAELAALAEQQATAEAEIASLKQAQADTEQALERQQQALEQAQAAAQAAADAAAVAALESPQAALSAVAAEVAALTQRREQLAAEIELSRRQFESEIERVTLAIERDKFEAERALADSTAAAAERWREYWQAPMAADLAEAEAEIGRLVKALEAKQGKPITWQFDQIRALLVRELDDGSLRPNHVRIAGESESGKSHMVNQLITDGLTALGLTVDIEVFDPYPSDTTWRVPPTIADDPAAVAARLGELRSECESSSRQARQRPLLVVVDEIDALILEFKQTVTDSLKVLLKRGRHCGIILWMLGQNGNVRSLAPMDWSDLKNAGGIYLNQVAFDYAKNGLAGRGNSVVGELEAVSARAPYYAAIHPKGTARPYVTAVPKVLFSQPATANSQPAAEVPASNKTPCPKCGGANTKSNGSALSGGELKRRIKCHSCGKSSIIGD